MKQETAKKTPKWLLPVIIAAAVLVIAGIVLAIVLGGGSSQQGQQQQGPVGPYELYWNVIGRQILIPRQTCPRVSPEQTESMPSVLLLAASRQNCTQLTEDWSIPSTHWI